MPDVIAEQMTGIPENPSGIGQFYDSKGNPVSREQAQDLFIGGETIELPNAGAGSYSEVFEALGYEETKPIEWSSSAGDWTFAVRDEETWYIAYQSNRYPRHGFAYSRFELPFDSYEDACRWACNC